MACVIGLHGAAGAGKDEFAKFAEEWVKQFPNIVAKRFSFALPIYDIVSVIFGTTIKSLGERSQKEIPVWRTVTQTALESAAELWEDYGLDEFGDFSYVWPIFEEKYFGERRTRPIHLIEGDEIYSILISAREILQLFGTELGRNMLGADVWLKTVEKQIMLAKADLNIITDVRFDNEAHFIHSIKGQRDSMVLKITSPKTKVSISSGHASEAGVSNELINDHFFNAFTGLDNLREDVNAYLEMNAFVFIV